MNRIAFVTGAASNIGLAVARRFLKNMSVVGVDLKFESKELRLIDQTSENHFYGLWSDISSPDSIREAFAKARVKGEVEAVLHCAAVTDPPQSIESLSYEEWGRLVDINLTGAFTVIKEAIPYLKESKGSALLMTSRAGKVGYAGLVPYQEGTKAHYAASKAGVISLVKSSALELARYNVRVNGIAPGSIEGYMIPKERWPLLAKSIPLSRLGSPEEVAEATFFLCSQAASYITGHILDVNGGTLMD